MKLNRLAEFFLAVWFLVLITHFWLERERILRDQFRTVLRVESLETKIDSLEKRMPILEEQVEKMNYIDLPEEIYFCGQIVPLQKPLVRRKIENEIFRLTKFRANRWRVDLYLSEAQFYFPYFEEGLTQDSLPVDLQYIAAIESEFDNEAKSPMNAVGMWQLIPATAIKQGLSLDYYVDDRRDFEEAFRAARAELKEAYQRFGDWFLVVAAYNAGTRRIREALDENREQRFLAAQKGMILDSTYFDLVLPAETIEYIPSLLAVKIVMENYQAYGFRKPPYTKADVEWVTYTVPERKKISEVAGEFGTSVPDFRFLNPRFVKKEIPAGVYKLKVLKKKK